VEGCTFVIRLQQDGSEFLIDSFQFGKMVRFEDRECLEIGNSFCEVMLVALSYHAFTKFCEFLCVSAIDATLCNHGMGYTGIAKQHVRVKIKAEEAMIAFNHGWFAEWTHPSVDKGSNCSGTADDEVYCLTSMLLCCRFTYARVLMVMEVSEICFMEDSRDLRCRIINWVIDIHADDYFFLLLSPLTDLLDKIGKEGCTWFRFFNAFCLEQSGLLSCDCL